MKYFLFNVIVIIVSVAYIQFYNRNITDGKHNKLIPITLHQRLEALSDDPFAPRCILGDEHPEIREKCKKMKIDINNCDYLLNCSIHSSLIVKYGFKYIYNKIENCKINSNGRF